MKLALLLVVCQSTLSLRPDVSQESLDVDESPCGTITPAELCKTKLRDGQCFFLDGPPLKRSLKRCLLRGPQEGFAEVRANTTLPSTSVSLSASRARASLRGGLIFRGIRLEFQGLHLRGARLQMYDTERGGLGTGSRTRQRDGGAMWAGKGGLKVADSQVYVNSSTAKAGGAIFVASRGQLLLTNHSKLVTENTHAMLSGGSIYARNFRMENGSALQVRKSSGKDGGAIAADMFVVRKGSKVNISEAESHRFGGAVSSARRVVVQYGSEVNITNCSAEAPGGGGIFALKIEVKNASIDVRRSFSTSVQGLGGCLFVSNSLFVRGGSVHLAHCEAFSAAGLRAGGSLMLLNSSVLTIEHSVAKSSIGALLAKEVRVQDSLLRVTDTHAAAPPAVMMIANELKMIGGTTEVTRTARDMPWPAVVVGSAIGIEAPDEFSEIRMTRGSRLIIRDAYAGILGGTNSSFQLKSCLFEDLNDTAVAAPAARELLVEDAVVRNIGAAGFACADCNSLELTRIRGRNVGALVRASGLHRLTLRNVEVYCASRGCITLGAAPVVLPPQPWLLEGLDIHLEDVDGSAKPMVLDLQAPKVRGSATELLATCPAGSFSLVQQTFGTVMQLSKGNILLSQGAEARDCCVSTLDIPETFLNANRNASYVLLPNLTEPCDPATSTCLCTDGRCKGQMRKSEMVFMRISCMSCPVGQYSLVPVARHLQGGAAGLFDSATLEETRHYECMSCDQVEVDKKPLCQGRSVIVPRGIMASPKGLHPNSSCSEGRLCFYRCPNAEACPEGDVVAAKSACALGYNDSYPGCSVCAEGFGRKNTDPFECLPCGQWGLSVLYFVLLPLGPVVLAVRSASQTEKERMSMMIKVIFSFGTFVGNLHTILAETEIYQSMQEKLWLALDIVEGAGDSSTLIATSFDCLAGAEQVTRWHHLLLQAFHPSLLLAAFCLLEFSHWRTAFQASWCRRCIVLGNTFLPGLFATFFQWSPCFHMQIREDEGFDSYFAYHISQLCPNPLQFSMPAVGLVLLLIAGPLFWALIVTSSRKWDKETRKTYVGFLIAGYHERCEWWEISVLMRKALLTAATVFFPVDYAPLSLVITTALIMLAALVGHLTMKPYADEFMNVLEGGILTYCMVALTFTLYLGSRSWSSTAKPSVFAALVVSMAVTSVVLLLTFILTALPRTSARSAERARAG